MQVDNSLVTMKNAITCPWSLLVLLQQVFAALLLISILGCSGSGGQNNNDSNNSDELPTVAITDQTDSIVQGGNSIPDAGSDGEESGVDTQPNESSSESQQEEQQEEQQEPSDSGSDGATNNEQTDTHVDSGETIPPEAGPDPTPVVRTPMDTQVVINEQLILQGTVSFNGMPIDVPVVEWKALSGPGNTLFADVNSPSTSASFDAVGSYTLELSATNGPFRGADSMAVEVVPNLTNQAPEVNAGPDETIEIDDVLNLSALVSDDGLPDGSLSGAWSKVSGPGNITFGEITNTDTTATFNATGDFVVQYTATDGELSAADDLAVVVESDSAVSTSVSNVPAGNAWQQVNTSNGSRPQERHEAAAVAFQNQLYLLGGRGKRQVNRYDPGTNRWENLGTPSFEFSHIQPVVYGGKIYVVGAIDCCFPSESVFGKVQIFDPQTRKWSSGATIPANRQRGSAGVVVYNDKIYIVGGTTNGHDGGMVDWFDEYNPANNSWKKLPDAPSKRDHFSAALVGNKLVAAGGRQTDHPNTFKNLVASVDIYDFGTGKWTQGQPIPTKRAGAMTVSHGDEVILIGGESDSGISALKTVEAYNVRTNSWRTLKSLNTQRHSGGAAIVGNAIHVVSGNLTTGGGAETAVHEKLNLNP